MLKITQLKQDEFTLRKICSYDNKNLSATEEWSSTNI